MTVWASEPFFSRCSLGKGRWFWVLYSLRKDWLDGAGPLATGYAATAADAASAARAIIPGVANGRAYVGEYYHRSLCVQRRAARPPGNGRKAVVQEFLYRHLTSEYDGRWYSAPHLVIKRTKKRVFVSRTSYRERDSPFAVQDTSPLYDDRPKTYSLDRAKLEADGSVWCREARDDFFTLPHDEYQRSGQDWRPWELATLGLKAGASPEQIKSAYRRLARQHHPDCGGDPERFKELQRAYERALTRR
jgi:hypothetical protein